MERVQVSKYFLQDKKAHTIRAKNVVVSASTLETPRLLLNSGIQGPAIGRYLTGHVSIIADWNNKSKTIF